MQLIDGTRLPSYEDTISEAKVRISDSEWVALIAEKGPIVDSLDQDIYNLLERIGLERLLA